MARASLLSALFVLGLTLGSGCSKSTTEAESGKADKSGDAQAGATGLSCDQPRLAELAKQLGATEGDAVVAVVAEGLLAACPDSLSPTTAFHLRMEIASPEQRAELRPPAFDDPALQALRAKVCADPKALDERLATAPANEHASIVYRECDLKRYELMSAAEAEAFAGAGWLTWTTHELLLQAQTPPELAKPISRALMQFEIHQLGPVVIYAAADMKLVELDGGSPLPEGLVIHASASELSFQQQKLASLSEGQLPAGEVDNHLVTALFEALEEEQEKSMQIAEHSGTEPSSRVLVVGDAGLRFGSLVDIMYTAGRAGLTEFALVVQTKFPVKRAIYLAPPKFPGPSLPTLKVFILDDGLRVIRPGADEAQELAALDFAKLDELAAAFAEQNPQGMAVVSAENTVPYEALVRTYATLLGPECDQRAPETCRFAQLVVEAGAG